MDSLDAQSERERASRFIRRLSLSLQALFLVLGAASVLNHLNDLLEFSAPQVTPEDARVLERMGWGLLIFQLLVWTTLTYCAYALLRRRNWARIVAIVVLGFLGFSLIWIGGGLVLSAFSSIPSALQNAPAWYQTGLRAIPAAIGAGALALAYLSWRAISRLRSAAIYREFGNAGSSAHT
jgi:hypothetical protein